MVKFNAEVIATARKRAKVGVVGKRGVNGVRAVRTPELASLLSEVDVYVSARPRFSLINNRI